MNICIKVVVLMLFFLFVVCGSSVEKEEGEVYEESGEVYVDEGWIMFFDVQIVVVGIQLVCLVIGGGSMIDLLVMIEGDL